MPGTGMRRTFGFHLFKQRQAKAAFVHLFGSHSIAVILMVCLTMISLSWFGDGLWQTFAWVASTLLPDHSPAGHGLGNLAKLLIFPTLLAGWWCWIKRTMDTVTLTVHEQEGPPGCKALILFLSPPKKDKRMVTELADEEKTERITIGDPDFRQRFQASWRMPMESIAYHLRQGRLETVLVIPSATVNKAGDNSVPGTYQDVDMFKKLLEKAAGDIDVLTAGDAASVWREGVQYESAKALIDCLKDVFDLLTGEHEYREDDVLIDITSGQKLVSSIGTLFSLQAGRQIQYVSTLDYSIKYYDIHYEEH